MANKRVAEETDDSLSPQRRAFLRLVKDVEKTVLLDTSSVTNLSQLCAQYNTYLNDEGIESESCRGDFLGHASNNTLETGLLSTALIVTTKHILCLGVTWHPGH